MTRTRFTPIARLALLCALSLAALACQDDQKKNDGATTAERPEAATERAGGEATADPTASDETVGPFTLLAAQARMEDRVVVDHRREQVRLTLALPMGYTQVAEPRHNLAAWHLEGADADEAPEFALKFVLGKTTEAELAAVAEQMHSDRMLSHDVVDGAQVVVTQTRKRHTVWVLALHGDIATSCNASIETPDEAERAIDLMREVCLSLRVDKPGADAEADAGNDAAVDAAVAQLTAELGAPAGAPGPKPTPTGDAAADLVALTAWARTEVGRGISPARVCVPVNTAAARLHSGSAQEQAAASAAAEVCMKELPAQWATVQIERAESDATACSELPMAMMMIASPLIESRDALEQRARAACPDLKTL